MQRSSTLRPGPIRISLLVCLLLVLILTAAQPAAAVLDFNVILHDVQITPVPGQLTYQVNAYVSVLDNQGLPVKNLKTSSFSLLEDSQPVEFSVREATDTPISLMLVMDTSGSMAGTGITSAQNASAKFASRMSRTDRLGVISFNNKVTLVSDFTENHAAVVSQLRSLAVSPGSGTCLYDAVYQAVQNTSLRPQGRRAVLLLTDGRDELPNSDKPCSSALIDDVIRLAATNINTPIYAIGVGKTIDANALQRLALLTGGSFLQSKDFAELDRMFDTMFDQLKYQYEFSYRSKAATGQHNLSVEVNLGGAKDMDTRTFLISERPPEVSIKSPINDQSVQGKTVVLAELTGQKEAVAQIAFYVNGQPAGKDESPPYTFEFNAADYHQGKLLLRVEALDGSGEVLSNAEVQVSVPAATATPTTIPSLAPTKGPEDLPATATAAAKATADALPATPTPEGGKVPGTNLLLLIGGGAALLILLAVVGLVVVKPFGKQRRPKTASPLVPDATFDTPVSAPLAELVVVFSDDAARIGEHYQVTRNVTMIGRGAINDLTFPNDHPVSRRHAMLEHKNGLFVLTEVQTDSDGKQKAPTFGTFVNERKISAEPVVLRSGDEIRMGNRLKLRFQARQEADALSSESLDGKTMDDINDSTLD